MGISVGNLFSVIQVWEICQNTGKAVDITAKLTEKEATDCAVWPIVNPAIFKCCWGLDVCYLCVQYLSDVIITLEFCESVVGTSPCKFCVFKLS